MLDPFAGIGATGVAAMRLSRRFVGIELAPAYVAEAARRLAALEPRFGAPVEARPEADDLGPLFAERAENRTLAPRCDEAAPLDPQPPDSLTAKEARAARLGPSRVRGRKSALALALGRGYSIPVVAQEFTPNAAGSDERSKEGVQGRSGTLMPPLFVSTGAMVTIHGGPDGQRLVFNGQEIGRFVGKVRFEMNPGEIATVTLEVLPEALEFMGWCKVEAFAAEKPR